MKMTLSSIMWEMYGSNKNILFNNFSSSFLCSKSIKFKLGNLTINLDIWKLNKTILSRIKINQFLLSNKRNNWSLNSERYINGITSS